MAENRLNDGKVPEAKHVSRESRGWSKDPKGRCRVAGDEEELMEIRQSSQYNKDDKAKPDNNPFFEKLSNPLSSKGN